MPNPELEFLISPDGTTVTVEGHHFVGKECETISKPFEEVLGTVTKSVKKPEYHRARTVGRTRQV